MQQRAQAKRLDFLDSSLYSSTREAAMRLLAFREHSAKELNQKLKKRCLDDDIRLNVIQSLSQENLQSDDRFTEVFVRSRITKGYGQIKIRMELSQKGISDEKITEYLADSSIDWLYMLKKQLNKRFLPSDFTNVKTKAKVYRYFQRRGFSFEQIQAVQKNR